MLDFLIEGFTQLTIPQIAMWLIGGLLIYLAIKKDMEPALLLPMGFGAILVNLPLSPVIKEGSGIISSLFAVGFCRRLVGVGCVEIVGKKEYDKKRLPASSL